MMPTTNSVSSLRNNAARTIQVRARARKANRRNRNPNVDLSASEPSNPTFQANPTSQGISSVQTSNSEALRRTQIKALWTTAAACTQFGLALASYELAKHNNVVDKREMLLDNTLSLVGCTELSIVNLRILCTDRNDENKRRISDTVSNSIRAVALSTTIDKLLRTGSGEIPYEPFLVVAHAIGFEGVHFLFNKAMSGLGSISAHVSRPTRSTPVVPVVEGHRVEGHRSRVTVSSTIQDPSHRYRPGGPSWYQRPTETNSCI